MTSPRAPRSESAPADNREGDAASSTVPAALRDAQQVAARIAEDELAADAERQRLTHDELPRLAEEAPFSLREDEILHAVRTAALLEDRQSALPQGGTLYLTSQRLVHAGQAPREVNLTEITETGVALERLLLVDLADGSALAIEVDQPRLLRVQLASARAAARGRAS